MRRVRAPIAPRAHWQALKHAYIDATRDTMHVARIACMRARTDAHVSRSLRARAQAEIRECDNSCGYVNVKGHCARVRAHVVQLVS